MKRTTSLLLLSIITISFANAQTAERKWAFGPEFGVTEYSGDYGSRFFKFNSGYAAGFSVFRYLNPSFDLGLNGFYDRVDYIDGDNSNFFQNSNWTIDPLVFVKPEIKYKLNNGYILKEDAFLRPFIKAGVGLAYAVSNGIGVNGLETNRKFFKPNLSAGPGIAIPIGNVVTIELATILNFPFNEDHFDLISNTNPAFPLANNNGDLFLQSSIALKFALGKAKDSDGDGVIDKKDLCPDTPAGVAVDENGCPLDTDKDGIPDYLDECPTIPGLKEFNGCPDTDGDGIPDKDDECPDVAGPAILKGCPDSDGDGVPDKDDRCPDTPKGYQVDRFGCPLDRDHDGIPDSEDDCPDVPGVAELKGCPFDVNTLMAKYGLSNKKILFDFDKADLRITSQTTLNDIYRALNNHEEFGVQFDGYTDWIGSEDYNLKLSERRADAAKNYLIQKGYGASRIKTGFYGEAQPVDTNETKDGRQNNRRTDWKLIKIK